MAMKEIKRPIRFKFDFDKFVSAMGVFAKKTKDFDKLKACKLLYYADKFHLLKYGRPILGDVYEHWDYGPVPTKSLGIMNEVICKDKIPSDTSTAKDLFEKYLKAKKKLGKRDPIFEVVKEPSLEYLSASEIEAIEMAIRKHGELTGGQLIDETHKDAPCRKTEMYEEIDYRLFFEDETDIQPGALEYLESLRENSELIFGLSSSD